MSIQTMIISLQNNRNQMPQRDRFKNRLGSYNPNNKTGYKLPEVTSKQLREIRKRLQSEHYSQTVKVMLVTILSCIVLVAVLSYGSNFIRAYFWY